MGMLLIIGCCTCGGTCRFIWPYAVLLLRLRLELIFMCSGISAVFLQRLDALELWFGSFPVLLMNTYVLFNLIYRLYYCVQVWFSWHCCFLWCSKRDFLFCLCLLFLKVPLLGPWSKWQLMLTQGSFLLLIKYFVHWMVMVHVNFLWDLYRSWRFYLSFGYPVSSLLRLLELQ